MNVELICVGSELISGDVVNTNASYISKKLRELGHESFRQFTVDDNRLRLSELIEQSVRRCDILILTGGLGPTADDITKETVCETLGIRLTENEKCRKHIENYFKNLNKVPTKNNYKQATAPEGAVIFPNDRGTACGIGIEQGDKRIIMLPGPPRELTHMFDTYVVPYLKKLNHHAIVTHTLNVFGLGESAIETIIKPFCEAENPVVATYCGNNECTVKITATADTEPEAEAICSKTMLKLKELLGDVVYGADSEGLANEVVNSLRVSGLKISTAESCTGGMLSQALTSVSHSSEVVEIGILAYSNRIKHEALSVPRDVLEENGAISPETAMYLAKNVRILSDSDIGVGITGNAGPSASENKPVGLVYIAIADKTKYFIKKLQLPSTYDRERIRSYATLTALDLVRRYVSARPFALPGMVSFDTEFVFEEDSKPATAVTSSNESPKDFDPNMSFIVFEPEDYEDENAEETAIPAVTEPAAPTTEEPAAESKNKKKPFANIAAALKRALPNRDDKAKDMIIKIVSIVALVGLILSSTVLIYHFAFENSQRQIIEEARESFDFDNGEINEATKQYSIFDELIAQNPDIRGWISISNTNIDNPIYQSDDNDYYLNYNMLKKKSRYGALFFDYNNNIELNNNSKNLTVYGHNTSDKSMFGTLRSYRSLKFYKQNPIIKLKTLYEQNDYAIFSIMITNASADDDNGYLYNFTRCEFSSDEDFMSWIAEAKERSLVNTGIEIQPDDEILTLSTCCYDFDNARFVVMAKKLSSDEPHPDVSGAKLNSNVRYPQAWYDEKGLEGYKKTESNSPASSSTSTSSEQSSSIDSSSVTSDESSSALSSSAVSSASSSSTTISTACVHTAGTELKKVDNNKHSYTCTKCGSVITVAHTFDQQTQTHLVSAATCTSAAVYYKSCKCGEKGSETFTYGSPLTHKASAEWVKDDTQHWHICENSGCNEKLDIATHSHDQSGKCVCGHIKPADTSENENVSE